jgi:hypothetical protein
MKFYYIVPLKVATEPRHVASHWFEIGEEKALICIDWKDDDHELAWSSRPEVISLPHPVFEASAPLTDEHHSHLQHHFQLQKGDNVHHVIKQAAKHDPWMRIHVL